MCPDLSENSSQKAFFEKLSRQTNMEQVAELLYVKILSIAEKHDLASECAVCFVDEDSLEFSIHKSSPDTTINATMQRILTEHISSGLIGWSISKNKNSFFTPAENLPHKSGLVVPIASANYSFGVIIILCNMPLSTLRAEFLQSIKTASEYGGLALENIRNMRTVGEYNQSLEARIREKTFELVEKNKMLEELAKELEEKKCRAEEANNIKSQFLANMSHEIRTPMNAIMGVAALLEKSLVNEEQKDLVSVISESGQILLNLINDILDLSKVESGEMSFESIKVDLYSVVYSCLKIVSHKNSESHIELLCKMSPDLPGIIMTDPTKLRQILLNLLSNAIKFTQEGYVQLSIHQSGQYLVMQVEDTGIGIEKSKQKSIFESFVQATASTTRNYGGTGLGLAITRKITEKMEGTIELDSTLGKGSCFTVRLPLRTPEYYETFFETEHKKLESLTNKSVIIIDSCQESANITAEYCSNAGMKVLAAVSSPDAASHHNETDFLLVSSEFLPIKNINAQQRTIPLYPCFTQKTPNVHGKTLVITKPLLPTDLLKLCLPTESKQHKPVHAKTKPFANKHILLAEDLLLNQKVAKKMLETIGFSVDIAMDGQEVIEKLKQRDYDLVLMDYHMPIMDGAQTTKKIRSGHTKVKNPHIPIVAMSANSIEEDIAHCLECGMNDYIVKPISLDKLETTLGKWLTASPKSPPEATIEYYNPDEAFQLAGESQEIMIDLLTIFVEEFPMYQERLKKAIDENDFENSKQNAHALKNMTSTIASKILAEQARKLEQAARDKNLEKCRQHFDKLTQYAPFVLDIITKKLKLEK